LSLPTTRSSCTHSTSRHAPILSGTNALSACAGSVANSRLYSPMKVSVSQWSAASTVSIPASLNSFGSRSCNVRNARSERPRA
jgi:hypothetical protein